MIMIKYTTIDANQIEIKMIPFYTMNHAFIHTHCNALEESMGIFFHFDKGWYWKIGPGKRLMLVSKFSFAFPSWWWMHQQSLELEGVGAVVWYRTGPMSGPPLGETSGAIGHHGVHRYRSKTFRHFFKGLTNAGEDITDPGFIGGRLLIRALKNKIRRATSHYRRYRCL